VVEVGGSFPAGAEPVLVGEDLQVAADGGLGELEDVAEVGDGEFVFFEEAKEAQADGVGEGVEPT
jgi:hypothetical protein